jgi:hypothetical protein
MDYLTKEEEWYGASYKYHPSYAVETNDELNIINESNLKKLVRVSFKIYNKFEKQPLNFESLVGFLEQII